MKYQKVIDVYAGDNKEKIMAYHEHALGETVDEVMKAFYNHLGEMDKKPFG